MDAVNPIQIVEPEKPYGKLAVSLTVFPFLVDNVLQWSVSIEAEPYRVLENGTYELYGKKVYKRTAQDIHAEAQNDPALGLAMQQVIDAIGGYLAAQGV